eukprot:4698830-Pyramimonas_sp.AAC.1
MSYSDLPWHSVRAWEDNVGSKQRCPPVACGTKSGINIIYLRWARIFWIDAGGATKGAPAPIQEIGAQL